MGTKKAWPAILLATAAVQLINLVNIPFFSTEYSFDSSYFNNGVLSTDVMFEYSTAQGRVLQAGGVLTVITIVLAIISLSVPGARVAAGLVGLIAGLDLLWAVPYSVEFEWDTLSDFGGTGMWVTVAAAVMMVIAGIFTIILGPARTPRSYVGAQAHGGPQSYGYPGAGDGMPAAPTAQDQRRPCPWCAELIQPAAVVCRFCNREVPTVERHDDVPQPTATVPSESPTTVLASTDSGKRPPAPPSDPPPAPPADPPPVPPSRTTDA